MFLKSLGSLDGADLKDPEDEARRDLHTYTHLHTVTHFAMCVNLGVLADLETRFLDHFRTRQNPDTKGE